MPSGNTWRASLRTLLPVLVALLPAGAVHADGLRPLLPESFAGWTTVLGSPLQTTAIESLAGDQAAPLRSCGIRSAERRSYARDADTLVVTLYRMRDPSAAYGAYSFLRPANPTAAKPTEHSTVARQQALLLTGDLLLEVAGRDVAAWAADLKVLADHVAPEADKAPYPTLAGHLPTLGFVPRSDRYLASPAMLAQALPLAEGDWLGFSDGAEAELARYRVGGQELTLLVVSYPTQQFAAKKLDGLRRLFDLDSSSPPAVNHPTIFVNRTSSLVALVAGARSEQQASSLLRQIHYETQVTWNEPAFSLTEPGINQMVVGALIGTGVIVAFTLVASLAFGGVRLAVKRFLPGVIFDRESSVEILQLGLTSKSIEAKDFY